MPAKSVAQQKFMGMVRATQKGEMKNSSPELKDAAKNMSKKDVRKFAKTKHKGLPDKIEEAKSAAWQRKAGKNPSGGLNEKGRKSYERENPGSDLKAPQPEGGPRKRSFCARMSGVKGPMMKDGKPTRKKLALDKWKCNEEMGNIAHTKTKKGGKTIINVNKNDEADAQKAMKNDPKYIIGKTRVQAYKEEALDEIAAKVDKKVPLGRKSNPYGKRAILKAVIKSFAEKERSRAGVTSEGKEACGKGEYWCREGQKCKPIPKGMHVMPNGDLMKGEVHKEEAPTMSTGSTGEAAGLSSEADDNGPVAGLDQPLGGTAKVKSKGKYKFKCKKSKDGVNQVDCRVPSMKEAYDPKYLSFYVSIDDGKIEFIYYAKNPSDVKLQLRKIYRPEQLKNIKITRLLPQGVRDFYWNKRQAAM